jgi:hypothetical protein
VNHIVTVTYSPTEESDNYGDYPIINLELFSELAQAEAFALKEVNDRRQDDNDEILNEDGEIESVEPEIEEDVSKDRDGNVSRNGWTIRGYYDITYIDIHHVEAR